MTTYQPVLSEAHMEDFEKYRYDLAEVAVFLDHFKRDDLYRLEETELMIIAQALAQKAGEKLSNVSAWLEEVQIEAEKSEVAEKSLA